MKCIQIIAHIKFDGDHIHQLPSKLINSYIIIKEFKII
jgi:hypothetical protein